MSIAEEKAHARPLAIQRRAEARKRAGTDASERIAALFLETIPVSRSDIVSLFWPLGDEIDMRPLLLRLIERGVAIALPVTVKRGLPLVFRSWRPGDPLKRTPFGVEEPLADKPALTPSIVVTPLLLYDGDGYRLGYGGGYYDRTLKALRERGQVLAVGVAFAAQRADRVPREAFDERLDWILTEDGAFEFEDAPRHAAAARA